MNTEAIADHVVEMCKPELSPLIARFVEGGKDRPGSPEAGCEGHPEAAIRDRCHLPTLEPGSPDPTGSIVHFPLARPMTTWSMTRLCLLPRHAMLR